MTFDEARERILDGTTALWNVVHCGHGHSGPSFRDRLTFDETDDEAPHVLHADSHHSVAVYKPDLFLSLAWGLTQEPDWQEPWVKTFSDPHAKSAFVDVFYCGALVWRDVYVVVDDGRGYLPIPSDRDDIQTVTFDEDRLMRLLNALDGPSRYDDLMSIAGFRVMPRAEVP